MSIGICAYNEEKSIGQLLDNLLTQQGLPAESEIIVMCDGCTDKTEEIVASFSEKDSRIRMITEPERKGKAPALNRLLRSYRGDAFIHIDADHIPSNGAIIRLFKLLKDNRIGAAQGCQLPINQNEFMDRLGTTISGLHIYAQEYFNSRAIGQHLGGGLFAIKRGVCDNVPEDIVNDDAYMGVMCNRKNLRVIFDKTSRVHFQSPRTVLELLAQRRRVVFGHLMVQKETGVAPMVLEMCPAKHRLRILIEWFAWNPTKVPYFAVCALLEIYVNLRARIDLVNKTGQHKAWVIAKTTKLGPLFEYPAEKQQKAHRAPPNSKLGLLAICEHRDRKH
jgi:cellulose synthase/poly-beta-1,6-N-acetylglucosamine synthase-like glycosyltransferase